MNNPHEEIADYNSHVPDLEQILHDVEILRDDINRLIELYTTSERIFYQDLITEQKETM